MDTKTMEAMEAVEGYFSAVDGKQLQAVLRYLAPDATFRIASFDTEFNGRDTEIKAMFERLFDRYQTIWHGDFHHVVDAKGCIASQFRVVNETKELERFEKFNANFFTMKNGLFTRITVYMSGDNSLA